MIETVQGRYDGKVIVPDEPLNVPIGQRLSIEVRTVDRDSSDADSLAALIALDPAVASILEALPNGNVVVRGHRITLPLLLHYHFTGESPAQLHERFPSLKGDVLQTVIDFVGRHEAVAREHLVQSQVAAQAVRDEAHRGPSVDELRSRLAARRQG